MDEYYSILGLSTNTSGGKKQKGKKTLKLHPDNGCSN